MNASTPSSPTCPTTSSRSPAFPSARSASIAWPARSSSSTARRGGGMPRRWPWRRVPPRCSWPNRGRCRSGPSPASPSSRLGPTCRSSSIASAFATTSSPLPSSTAPVSCRGSSSRSAERTRATCPRWCATPSGGRARSRRNALAVAAASFGPTAGTALLRARAGGRAVGSMIVGATIGEAAVLRVQALGETTTELEIDAPLGRVELATSTVGGRLVAPTRFEAGERAALRRAVEAVAQRASPRTTWRTCCMTPKPPPQRSDPKPASAIFS